VSFLVFFPNIALFKSNLWCKLTTARFTFIRSTIGVLEYHFRIVDPSLRLGEFDIERDRIIFIPKSAKDEILGAWRAPMCNTIIERHVHYDR